MMLEILKITLNVEEIKMLISHRLCFRLFQLPKMSQNCKKSELLTRLPSSR